MTQDLQPHPETVATLVAMLVGALKECHGLLAAPHGGNMVWASNLEAEPPLGTKPHIIRSSPGLRQSVLCRMDPDGHLGWYWIWSAPGEISYEWFATAVEIDAAAARIAHVLAVRPEAVS